MSKILKDYEKTIKEILKDLPCAGQSEIIWLHFHLHYVSQTPRGALKRQAFSDVSLIPHTTTEVTFEAQHHATSSPTCTHLSPREYND